MKTTKVVLFALFASSASALVLSRPNNQADNAKYSFAELESLNTQHAEYTYNHMDYSQLKALVQAKTEVAKTSLASSQQEALRTDGELKAIQAALAKRIAD